MWDRLSYATGCIVYHWGGIDSYGVPGYPPFWITPSAWTSTVPLMLLTLYELYLWPQPYHPTVSVKLCWYIQLRSSCFKNKQIKPKTKTSLSCNDPTTAIETTYSHLAWKMIDHCDVLDILSSEKPHLSNVNKTLTLHELLVGSPSRILIWCLMKSYLYNWVGYHPPYTTAITRDSFGHCSNLLLSIDRPIRWTPPLINKNPHARASVVATLPKFNSE